jgi:hypothetical protein
MKNFMRGLAVLCILISTACSSPGWVATLQTPSGFEAEQPLPLVVEVNENGKPVTGLKMNGVLEMVKMDHGTIEVDFKEIGNGKYEGTVELPMGGDWNAILKMEKGNKSKEQTVAFKAG